MQHPDHDGYSSPLEVSRSRHGDHRGNELCAVGTIEAKSHVCDHREKK